MWTCRLPLRARPAKGEQENVFPPGPSQAAAGADLCAVLCRRYVRKPAAMSSLNALATGGSGLAPAPTAAAAAVFAAPASAAPAEQLGIHSLASLAQSAPPESSPSGPPAPVLELPRVRSSLHAFGMKQVILTLNLNLKLTSWLIDQAPLTRSSALPPLPLAVLCRVPVRVV